MSPHLRLGAQHRPLALCALLASAVALAIDPLATLPVAVLAALLLAGRLPRAATAVLLVGLGLTLVGATVPASERPAASKTIPQPKERARHGAHPRSR